MKEKDKLNRVQWALEGTPENHKFKERTTFSPRAACVPDSGFSCGPFLWPILLTMNDLFNYTKDHGAYIKIDTGQIKKKNPASLLISPLSLKRANPELTQYT